MVILSTEEEVEEGRGRREWLQERQMDRPNGGFGRGYGRDNNARVQQQAPTDRPQLTRQEDEWSSPPNVERRDDTERHDKQHKHLPQLPLLLQKKDYLPTGVVKTLQEKG